MSVFIILIYYIEKFIIRMKRKKNRPDINESTMTTA
jgi:hypothetical protein